MCPIWRGGKDVYFGPHWNTEEEEENRYFFPVNITGFEAKEAAEKLKNGVGELGSINTLALIWYFHFCDYPLINFN